MDPHKLYVVVSSALTSGLKAAQAVHAAIAFWAEHPTIAKPWYSESNNIVVLQHDDVGALADTLNDHTMSRFHEPDLDGKLTAICVEPAAWRRLSQLRLAN